MTAPALPGSPTEQHQCQHCRTYWSRPRTKGQRPKWCPDCRTNPPRYCQCGQPMDAHSKQCVTCYNNDRRPAPKQLTLVLPTDQRSPLRRAMEAGDRAAVIAAIRERCTITAEGCWLWNGSLSKDGYPQHKNRGRNHPIHRIALEAKHGQPLGPQPAHHTCAVTQCANPDHLVPVTQAENTAEMLARRAYDARIAELEAALAAIDPTHPLLCQIPVGQATRGTNPLGTPQPPPMA